MSEDIIIKQEVQLPYRVGEQYFFRTVTNYATGRVKEIVGKFLILEEGAWIAETERFYKTIKDGELREVEPVEDLTINSDTIVDSFIWKHKLPREQK